MNWPIQSIGHNVRGAAADILCNIMFYFNVLLLPFAKVLLGQNKWIQKDILHKRDKRDVGMHCLKKIYIFADNYGLRTQKFTRFCLFVCLSTCHMSHVTIFFILIFFLGQRWSLSVKGLLSMGRTSPSFICIVCHFLCTCSVFFLNIFLPFTLLCALFAITCAPLVHLIFFFI